MNELNLLPEYSEKHDVILDRIMKAKSDMGTAVKKDSENPFHKSKYASLGAHLDLCEPVLLKHGLLMLPKVNVLNNQFILIATLHHVESGQWAKSYLPLLNPKNDSQGVGASLTYMRRYAINSFFSLNAEDDDGETASGRGKYDKQAAKTAKAEKEDKNNNAQQQQQQEKPAAVERVGKAEIVALTGLVQKLDEENNQRFLAWIKKHYNANCLQEIPRSCFDKCMISINAQIKYINDKNKQQQQQDMVAV